MLTHAHRERRRKYICASDIPALLGLSPWASPSDIFWQKRPDLLPGGAPEGIDDEPNENQLLGLSAEGLILEYAEKKRFWSLGIVRNQWRVEPEEKYLGATLDAITRDGLDIIEAKYSSYDEGWGTPDSDEIPDHYQAQVQTQLAVVPGAERVHVYALRPRFHRLRIVPYYIKRNEPMIEVIRKTAREFWENHVAPGVPPDSKPPPIEMLQRVKRLPVELEIDRKGLEAVEMWEIAKEERKAAQAREEEAKALVVYALGDREAGRLSDGRAVSYRPIERRYIDVSLLKQNHPEIARELERTTITAPILRVAKTRPKDERRKK